LDDNIFIVSPYLHLRAGFNKLNCLVGKKLVSLGAQTPENNLKLCWNIFSCHTYQLILITVSNNFGQCQRNDLLVYVNNDGLRWKGVEWVTAQHKKWKLFRERPFFRKLGKFSCK